MSDASCGNPSTHARARAGTYAGFVDVSVSNVYGVKECPVKQLKGVCLLKTTLHFVQGSLWRMRLRVVQFLPFTLSNDFKVLERANEPHGTIPIAKEMHKLIELPHVKIISRLVGTYMAYSPYRNC